MNRILLALGAALLLAPLLALLLGRPNESPTEPVRPPAALVEGEAGGGAAAPARPEFRMPGEDTLFRAAARTAWAYVESQYHPGTGLVSSVIQYPYATVWDIGSTLAAYYCAFELGLLDQAAYDERMRRALRTLQSLPLYRGMALNKNYQVVRGLPAGRDDRTPVPGDDGYGWSALDHGRLLVWLKVIALAHPQHAAEVEAVVRRLNLEQMVRDGYLWGGERTRAGRARTYQEGRIGYEQYAAAGFALWGVYADQALSLEQNAEPVEVLGVTLFTDRRGDARLTSEPFMLMGLELGWWTPVWQEMAARIVDAQRARFERTGQVTMVSEDAVPVAPHYFYYYTLHHADQSFTVTSLTSSQPLQRPRWVSTKAAFAWYALLPASYTWHALQAVAPARSARGWSSGVFEENGRPTGGENINTAAVVLEAAVYHARERPLLSLASPARER